jgi:transaldolase/glucose-6-phosphate isomerase
MSTREELRLGGFQERIEDRLARWEREGFGRRLWEKDHRLWSPEPIPELADRLGWLDLPVSMGSLADRLTQLGREAAAEGIREAVVLGMGGSSLAPEVFAHTFGPAAGHPTVSVLDSTHPDAVRALADRLDLSKTWFVVSSKSGTTTEMLSFFYYFWDRLAAAGDARGRHFLAVTDPGTPLQKLAEERGFRAVVNAPPDVGGRYSALTPFGLVPAGLLGIDLNRLLAAGKSMADACGPSVPAADNLGLRLGATLGELALAGRDKVTFATSAGLVSFPEWIEQLIAESTGKIVLAGGEHRGIVPVAGEPLGAPEAYGDDRVFAALRLAGDEDGGMEAKLAALEAAGHPVIRLTLDDAYDLGSEMVRWELAPAAAGAVLELNPFDQPDVQLAKELSSKAMKAAAAGAPPASGPEVGTEDAEALAAALAGWVRKAQPGDYLGVHAYLAPTPRTSEILRNLQARLHDKTRLAVTLGYGPRFLHSTGQLHKGGPDECRFLQLVDKPMEDVAVPETSYTFGTLIHAQADGDRQALEQRGREVLRLQLGSDDEQSLYRLLQDLETAF